MPAINDSYYRYGRCPYGYTAWDKCKSKPIVQERPKVSFESGKPVCSSGAAYQDTSSVQKPDGTWTTVSTGSWMCPYAPRKPTFYV